MTFLISNQMFTSPLKSFCPGLKHRVLCFTFDMSQGLIMKAKSESRKSLQLIPRKGWLKQEILVIIKRFLVLSYHYTEQNTQHLVYLFSLNLFSAIYIKLKKKQQFEWYFHFFKILFFSSKPKVEDSWRSVIGQVCYKYFAMYMCILKNLILIRLSYLMPTAIEGREDQVIKTSAWTMNIFFLYIEL